MKSNVAEWSRILYCIRIVTVHGPTLRLCQYPYDVQMGAETYQGAQGYEFTGIEAGSDFAASSVDLSGFVGVGGITLPQIASGLFDSARVYLFATDWANPVEDEEPIASAIFGKTAIEDEKYTAEIMLLIDALNQTVGKSYGASCPKVFGGQEFAGCGVDLGPITVTGSLTGVTSAAVFTDSGRGEAADYFAAGTIQFTTGNNAGLKPQEVKRFDAGGEIEVFEPFPYLPEAGDEYTLIPGCRKRFAEDCRDKWNNSARFGGFPHIPTRDEARQRGMN
jgi:uncharacterized phage protein (TIGR02218 family)